MGKLSRVQLTKLGAGNDFTIKILECMVGQMLSSFFTDSIIDAAYLKQYAIIINNVRCFVGKG